jgi:eukaryotic-like serine/threonine-protein kinase
MTNLSPSPESELDEIIAAYVVDCEAGHPPDTAAWLARHEEFRAELEAFLAARDQLQRLTAPLRALTSVDQLPQDATLGDFRIGRELGRGGMGVVYEAVQTSLSRRVALKILPLAAMLDPRRLQRFRNEAIAAASLDHPHIVEVYGFGCERGVHYYAMRYIDGISLAAVIEGLRNNCGTRLRNDSIPCAKAPERNARDTGPSTSHSTWDQLEPAEIDLRIAELGQQAAEALHHAHQMGIVHRDIKPSNLLLDQRGQLWVTDFGLARIDTDASLTMSGDLLGTLRYMSPEQAEGYAGVLDHRTDIYSLGMTLYELLTLRTPFLATGRSALLQQIVQDDPSRPRSQRSSIPVDLETIVLKSIAKDPRDRYSTAADLAADLQRFLQHLPISATAPTRWQRTVRWARRHASFVLIASGALLATTLVALAAMLLVAKAYREKAAETHRADEQSRLAREVVDEMYVKVAHEWLANQPRMSQVQREFLQKASQYYEQLARDQPRDQSATLDRAKVLVHLSTIRRALGDLPAAETDLRAADASLQALIAQGDTDEALQARQGHVYLSLGANLAEQGRVADGRVYSDRAIQVFRELATKSADAKHRANAAHALQNLGSSYLSENRVYGEQLLREAIAIYESLIIAKTTDNDELRADAARANVNLGSLLNGQKRYTDAERVLSRAIDWIEPTITDDLDRPDELELLAGAHYALSTTLRHLSRLDEAIAAAEQSVQVLTQLASSFPDIPRYRKMLQDAQQKVEASRRAAGVWKAICRRHHNWDGLFTSADLVATFAAGSYDRGQATWATGDWDGNQKFNSADLILAFQDGGYEAGPRAALNAVPEPHSGLLLLGTVGLLIPALRRVSAGGSS